MALGKVVGGFSSGGGSTQYPVWSPHKPPASANALDVEFAGSSSISAWPAGWTASASGDFPNAVFPNTDPGRFSTQDTVATFKGRYATCPAGDFNLAAYVAVQCDQANYALASIGIIPSTTVGGFGLGANAAQMWAGYNGGFKMAVENTGGLIQDWGAQSAPATGVVMWVRRSGSNWFWGWSIDGQKGPEAGPFTGYSPTNIHVASINSRGVGAVNVFRWVRVITSSGARQSWGGLL